MKKILNWLAVLVILIGITSIPIFLWEDHTTFFKMAYDEDFYFSSVFHGMPVGRFLSSFILMKVFELTNSHAATILFSEYFSIIFISLFAFLISSILFKRFLERVFSSLVIAYLPDLISFANYQVWEKYNIQYFRNLFDGSLHKFIPDSIASFLTILRSPEPQLSFVVFFFLVYLLFKMNLKLSLTFKDYILIFICSFLLGTAYIFILLSSIVALGLILLMSIYYKNKSLISTSSLTILVSLVTFAALSFYNGTISNSASSVVFNSHLPSLTPSLIYSFFLLTSIIILQRSRFKVDFKDELIICIAFALTPIVLTNQQILTGKMVSLKEWEKYSSYLFISISLLALFSIYGKNLRIKANNLFAINLMGIVLLTTLIFKANLKSYEAWLYTNTIAKEVGYLLKDTTAREIIIDPEIDVELINLNTKSTHKFYLKFSELFTKQIGNLVDNKSFPENHYYYRNKLFLVLKSLNISEQEMFEKLNNENLNNNGTFINLLFSFRDAWYQFSDSRELKSDIIKDLIPEIAKDYGDFLKINHDYSSFYLVASNLKPVNSKFIKIKSSKNFSLYIGGP